MLTVFIANCIHTSAYKSKKNHIRTHLLHPTNDSPSALSRTLLQPKCASVHNPYRVRSEAHGLSHGLRNMPPACFLPSLRSGRPFKSCATQKSPTANAVGLFWQGHALLNPVIYMPAVLISHNFSFASFDKALFCSL